MYASFLCFYSILIIVPKKKTSYTARLIITYYFPGYIYTEKKLQEIMKRLQIIQIWRPPYTIIHLVYFPQSIRFFFIFQKNLHCTSRMTWSVQCLARKGFSVSPNPFKSGATTQKLPRFIFNFSFSIQTTEDEKVILFKYIEGLVFITSCTRHTQDIHKTYTRHTQDKDKTYTIRINVNYRIC